MAFKIDLLANVAGFLKGTKSVEDELDKVADSLDELARDTKDNADKAADGLEREFSDAFDKVKTEAKDTGRRIGDGIKDGTRKAEDGVDNLKDEAKQSAKETAASFSDVSDALDLVQEVAANAFAGFGPAGMAAGALAAVGVGLIGEKMAAAEEAAEAARERISDLAGEIADVDGKVSSLDWSSKINELLYSEVEGSGGQTWIQKYGDGIKNLGLDSATFAHAMQGDRDALDAVTAARERAIAAQNSFTDTGAASVDQINAATSAIAQQNTEVNTAANMFAEGDAAVGGFAEAQQRAADASEDFSDALTDNLSVADEGLDRFVKKGKLKVQEWTKALEERAGQNARIKSFTVDVDTELSSEALEDFAKLPTETQDQIAKAFKGGGKGTRKQIIQNLEAEAKVDKVTIDTSGAKTAAAKNPIEIPTTVATSGATKGAQEAADAAQGVADRSGNRIEYKTKLDASTLQRDVNRAAASITPPTIWAKVKVKKEVP